MKKIWKSFLAIAISLAFIVSISAPVLAETSMYNVKVPVTYGQTEARKILNMINEFRTGKDAWYWNGDNTEKIKCENLNTLQYDYNLEKIAMQRAAEIAIVFAHERPNGKSFSSLYNFNEYTYFGENIAAGYSTAKSVFVGWQETNEKASGQGHRRNMLSSAYTSVGIGHVRYNNIDYWVQEFGNAVITPEKTTANDSDTKVPVEVAKDKVKLLTVTPSKKTMELVYGKTASLPSLRMNMSIENQWPSYAKGSPVKTSYTWKVKDTSIVEIKDNKLVAKKPGTTTISSSALGKTASVKVTVKATATPKIKKITTKKKKATLTWGKIKEAKGYKIYMATKKNGKYRKIKTISKNTTTNYTKSKLKKGKNYYFKIRTYKKISGKTYHSDYSKVYKIKIK